MTAHIPRSSVNMPTPTPLNMPEQDLSRPFTDPRAPALARVKHTWLYRFATFLPALATTFVFVAILHDWFHKDGFVAAEIAMIVLVGISSFWIALSVATSTIGVFVSHASAGSHRPSKKGLRTALIVPIFNEDEKSVFARVTAMRQQLLQTGSAHKFALFILSDTCDERIAQQEILAFNRLGDTSSGPLPVYYRRRLKNTERKTGNIRDWIENWGADWDAFITLDADSLMSAKAIITLADDLSTSPQCGLIQTIPKLLGANSLFGKVQQFSNNVYGGVLARGLNKWSGNEGNYWGHNAIIRTQAFAACAGLPRLSGKGALSGTIKSHDFVEAALLRRAGWAVQLRPAITESYEEPPQTIIDYVLRDRRWCQGNLQHLRLLKTRGFSNASRFHMLQGAMGYIASLLWFVLLVLWALMGRSESETVLRYFSDTNPLFPQWPEMDAVSRFVVLCLMFGLLLLPKVVGVFSVVKGEAADTGWRLPRLGGPARFISSAFLEIMMSFILAPIMMIQHVNAVLRTLGGFDTGWAPQNRSGTQYPLKTLARFHWLETLIGAILTTGMALGLVSLWLLPVAVSLLLAIPISLVSGWRMPKRGVLRHLLATKEVWSPPAIVVTTNKLLDTKATQTSDTEVPAAAVPA